MFIYLTVHMLSYHQLVLHVLKIVYKYIVKTIISSAWTVNVPYGQIKFDFRILFSVLSV